LTAPSVTAADPCPLCGEPLYGWIALRRPGSNRAQPPAILDRCENCGVALERGVQVDPAGEWEAICSPAGNGAGAIAIPDRASLQAAIGVDGWAAISESRGRLLLTRSSLELLAERNGYALGQQRWPAWGRNQRWMWQTLLNGLTFHPNFAREWRAGRLRAATARSRLTYAVDVVVTVLGAPLVALVSFPLEAVAALARRGGELRAVARRSSAS
jgi:hypothetical protein